MLFFLFWSLFEGRTLSINHWVFYRELSILIVSCSRVWFLHKQMDSIWQQWTAIPKESQLSIIFCLSWFESIRFICRKSRIFSDILNLGTNQLNSYFTSSSRLQYTKKCRISWSFLGLKAKLFSLNRNIALRCSFPSLVDLNNLLCFSKT